MRKKVFIKTVVEECIGKLLLPSEASLSLNNGIIEILATENTRPTEIETIESSIELILDKAETLHGLHFKYSESTFPGCHLCKLYIEKETEKEIHFLADGVNTLRYLF